MRKQGEEQRYLHSLASRLKEKGRRLLSLLLSVSMIACGMPSIPAWAATADSDSYDTVITVEKADTDEDEAVDEDDGVQEFYMTLEDLVSALKDALIEDKPIGESAYKFTGAAKDDYDELFYWDDVYELFPEIDDDKDGHLDLKIFARITGDRDLDSVAIDGSEQIIFLLLNRTDDEETARICIDQYDSGLITVVPKGEVVLADEELEIPAEELEAEPEEEVVEEEVVTEQAAPAPAVSGGAGAGGAGGSSAAASDVAVSVDDGMPQIDPFDDGSESYDAGYESGDSGYDAGETYEGESADAGYTGDQTYDNPDMGSGWDDSYTGDAGYDDNTGADTGDYGSADDGSGYDGGYDDSGYDGGSADAGYDDGGSSEGGSYDDSASSDAGSADAGSDSGSDAGSGSDTGSSDSGSSDSGSADSGSSDSGSSDSGSSDNGSSDSGSSDSGSSDSSSSDSESSTSLASISGHTIGLLTAPHDDEEDADNEAETEDDDDEDAEADEDADDDADEETEIEAGDADNETADNADDDTDTADDAETDIDGEADADEEATEDETSDDGDMDEADSSYAEEEDTETSAVSGSVDLDGETYEAVIVNGRRSGVAFVTSLEDLGIDKRYEIELEEITYKAEDGGIAVSVTAKEGALPKGAKLVVTRYEEESPEYEAAALAIDLDESEIQSYSTKDLIRFVPADYDASEEDYIQTGKGMAALDISFLYKGEKVEPKSPVAVYIDISELLPEGVIAEGMEVHHLVEDEDGEVAEAVLVASDIEAADGYVDVENATAEFEVESFSTFTVTWTWQDQQSTTASSVSITVTAYLDGQELEGLDNIEFDSQDDELNLETMLNEEHFGTSDYIFSWAYVTYTSSSQGGPGGGGTTTNTIGTQDDPVEAIEKTAGGQSSFIVVQSSGTKTTVQSSYNLHLYAYYVTPTFTVEITPVAEDEAEDWLLQATLSHAGDYESVEYVWSVTGTDGSETSLATVDWNDETGRAFIVWDENVQNFDEVIVHVTATITREDGSTTSASADYTLEYGDENVNLQMTYGPDNTALGVGVTVKLTNTVTGQTYEGTTDANGQILGLEIEPGIYLVEASTMIGDSNYSCSETVSMSDAGTYTINLNYADAEKSSSALDPDKDDWNHVDIKLSTGSSDSGVSSEGVTVNITGVIITGENDSGETVIKYTADSTSIAAGASDNEWQIYFYEGTDTGGSYSHSINFATTDSITIVYTLQWEDSDEPETFTVTIDMDSAYDSGTTYPANGQRAYKLYNYLYGTDYSSNAQLMAAGVDSIDISDMSMMLVAAILCDSSTVNEAGNVSGTAGMWGMDFALSVEGFVSLSTAWTFDVEKTYENHAMTADMFTFDLYDASVSGNVWKPSTWEYTWSNEAAGMGIDRNSSDTKTGIYIPYNDDEIEKGTTYYYILSEEQGNADYTSYDSTVFGVEVHVYIDEEGTSPTYGEAVIDVTYYILTKNDDGTYNADEYSETDDEGKITFSDDEYPTFHFTNIYSTAVTLEKTDPYGNIINAQFTLTQVVTDPNTGETRICYYDPLIEEGDPWKDYDPDSQEPEPFTLGSIGLETPYDGTYTLTEITSAEGYGVIPDAITFDVEDGKIITSTVSWLKPDTEEPINDYVTIDSNGLGLVIADPDTTTSVTVKKVWDDTENYDGIRPSEITIQLTADKASYGDSITLTSTGNQWSYTFEDLPVHNKDGNEIKYSIEEIELPDGYESDIPVITGDAINGYVITITNTHDLYTGSLIVSKIVLADEEQKESSTTYTITIIASDDIPYDEAAWEAVNAVDAEGQNIELLPESAEERLTQNGVSFTITDGDEITISGLLLGDYIVSEETSGSDVFTVSYVVISSNGEEGESTSESPTVTVVNNSSSENTDDEEIPEVIIINEYPVTANIPVKKAYTGTDSWPDEGFTFTLTAVTTDAPMPSATTVTATSSEAVSFGEMTYTTDGKYYYKVTENEGTAVGVTYDSTIYYIQVIVSTNDNVKTVTVKYTTSEDEVNDPSTLDWESASTLTNSELPFSNSYNAEGSIKLSATKTYDGADLTDGLFSFTITETTEDVDEDDLYSGTGTNDASGNIIFIPDITYTQNDAGSHTYVITEINDEAGGVTYDSNTITVTVNVEDNGNGTLSTTVTVGDEDEEILAGDDGSYNIGTFKNSYEATGDVTLTVTKTISGMSSTIKTFNFTLYNSNEDFTYNFGDTRSTASTTNTLTEDEAQTITFPTISYTKADTYYFVIIESSQGVEGDGWTYDGKEYHVTVEMKDDGKGNLIPTVTYVYVDENGDTQTAESADFTNTYKAAATSVQFAGTKYISNSNGTNKVFTFELYKTEDDNFDTTNITPEEVKTSGNIDEDGQNFKFSEITYDKADTYYYVIKEKELDEANGWTISETVYYITVDVTDNLSGQLVANVSYEKEIDGTSTTVTGSEDVYDGFDFTNTYAATGTVGLTALKSLSGRAISNTTFTFALYNSDANFVEGSQIDTQSTSGIIEASQQIGFEELEYEYDSSNTYPMNYYYIIKETTTDGNGWTCDPGEYHVTVTVTDDGTGTLTTLPTYVHVETDGTTSSADNATFTNTYAATGDLNLTGTKIFTGGTITDGQFTYIVMEGETQVATGTVAADGTITFTQIDYTYSDIGPHTYIITEDSGSDSSVQYDETSYTVVATVTDNETGKLAVTYTVNGEENSSIEFNNYQKGSMTITKTFTGLSDDQIASLTDFTITVTNSDSNTVATLTLEDAKKDSDGTYTWTVSDLVADTYTVTESSYNLDGYEVITKSGEVTLTSDGSDASVNDILSWGGEDKVEFNNEYTEVGSITISKYVTAEEDIQEAHEDTSYTIVITALEDANLQWVTATRSDAEKSEGQEFTPDVDNENKTITITIKENGTVTINGLPAGNYKVEETSTDAMTSEHCVPNYRVDDEDTEGAPTVTVSSGEGNIVYIEIDNEYPIGTYIMVKKEYNREEYPTEGFTFTIEALSCDLDATDVTLTADKMPMPQNTSVTITNSEEVGYFGYIGTDGKVVEGMNFEHLGTYYYKIIETSGSEKNVDYDSSVHYIKVVVDQDEETHILTTDEYEAASEETEDYKNLQYEEAGIVTARFNNTAYEELTIEKEVAGDAGNITEYEFEITLTKDGEGYTGDIETTEGSDNDTEAEPTLLSRITNFFSGIVKMFSSDDEESSTITFTDGKGTVTIKAGESVTLLIPSGWDCTVTEKTTGANTITVYDGDDNVIVQAKGTTTEATAELGTIADSTQVKFVNSYRAYYPIDEEIVTDTDDIFDRDAWIKDEAVNEYNAIEIEMTTNLPVVTAYDLANGEFTMNFHEVLDHELVLDEDTADFSVYIGETAISTAYYRITFDDDTGDDCNFHVDVDLTALYNDGVVTEDMLDGNTEITIFFFADLEGTGLNGSYTSTVWYEIYDGDEWLYTADPSVVEVYTYEIEIFKYDSETGDALAGATLGVYYDKECSEPVSRNGEDYTVTSGDDGMIIFYGLADGTYYVKEIKAPDGYILSDEVLTVELGKDLNSSGYAFTGEFANTPGPKINIEGSKTWDDNNDQEGDRPASITIRLLADGKETESKVITAADGWSWSFLDLDVYDEDGNEITYTIMEDSIDDYSATYDGYDVTNTHTPGKTSLSVTKAWNDANDIDGIRPDSITVELIKNGEETGDTLILSAANSWIGTFMELDIYTDGVKNDYSVAEISVSGYSTAITGDTSKGYAITNTHTPNNNGGNGGTGGTSGGRHSSSGGGGGGSSTRSTGVSTGGPGTGESEGEDDIWNLLPLAQTGEPLDMLFGTLTLAISAMSLIVLLLFKKKWEIE